MNVWCVLIPKKVAKQLAELDSDLQEMFDYLARELQIKGPVLHRRPNFQKNHGTGKIDCYHCHLQRGRPTYVVIWRVLDKKARQLEICYVGTHEKADYRRHCGV